MNPSEAIRGLSVAIRNLDARIRAVENREPKATIATSVPVLSTGWTNAGTPYVSAGYWRDSVGSVMLQGRVIGGAFPSTIFTLPTGYRPAGTQQFAQGNTLIEVRVDGTVRTVSGSGAVSLDGIIFRTTG